MGRKALAAELGLGNSTVTRIAKALGLDFSRAKTAVAIQARSIDLAAGRHRLAEKMLGRAEQMLDDLDGPYLVYAFGGKENVDSELEKPPVEMQRTAVTTAGRVRPSDEVPREGRVRSRDGSVAAGHVRDRVRRCGALVCIIDNRSVLTHLWSRAYDGRERILRGPST